MELCKAMREFLLVHSLDVKNIRRNKTPNDDNEKIVLFQTTNARTNLYYNYILPSSVRAWNDASAVVVQSDSVNF